MRGLALGLLLLLLDPLSGSWSQGLVGYLAIALGLVAPATFVDAFPGRRSRARTLLALALSLAGVVQCAVSVQALRAGHWAWVEFAALSADQLHDYALVCMLLVWPASVCSVASEASGAPGESDLWDSLGPLLVANTLAMSVVIGGLLEVGWPSPIAALLGALLGAACSYVGLFAALGVVFLFNGADAAFARLVPLSEPARPSEG